MKTRLTFFILGIILLFSPFSAVSGEPVHSPIVFYSRDQLLASVVQQCHRTSGLMSPAS